MLLYSMLYMVSDGLWCCDATKENAVNNNTQETKFKGTLEAKSATHPQPASQHRMKHGKIAKNEQVPTACSDF